MIIFHMKDGRYIKEESLLAVDQYVGCVREFEVPLEGFIGMGHLEFEHFFIIEFIPGF